MLVMVNLKLLLINFRLHNILRVPDLASNLLSVHKLCLQNDAFCYFDTHKFLIQDLLSGKILYKGLSKDGVYPIPSPSTLSSSSAFNSKSTMSTSNSIKSDVLLLWHYRLGHPSSSFLYYALKPFCHSITLSQIVNICSSCKYCMSAKMHKYPLAKTSIVSNFVLDIVHCDVWGPAPLSSVLGFSYYVVFMDDYTRFTWLFLLKHKNEVLSVFKHFKAFVENQFSTSLKVLRTDNGTEYTNSALQAFCSSNGILHQTSCPHSP